MHNENIYTPKKINDLTIALISDIHYSKKFNHKIFDKLKKQLEENKADYLAIAGDILDGADFNEYEPLLNWFKEISKKQPIIIVLGNHDEKAGHMWKWKYQKNVEFVNRLKNLSNVHYLEDTSYTDNNITFYGFNLSYKHYEEDDEPYEGFCEEVKRLNCNFDKKNYNIILLHSPINIYKFIKNNPKHELSKCDLILSGHMHNGILPYFISHPLNKIFKTNRSFFSPSRKFFQNYSQGRVYKIKDGIIYEGLTKLGNSTKIFSKLDFIFPKKIQYITIKKNK